MRAPAKQFQELVVWQKAHALVLEVYRLTTDYPREETYCLTSQLRRAAVSVPANIAEGFKKKGRADKARYLNIVQGSLEEARYYLLLAGDLGYRDFSAAQSVLAEVSKLPDSNAKAIRASDFCIQDSAP